MSASNPPGELHLPDLPDVAVAIGGTRRAEASAVRHTLSPGRRVLGWLSTYLPLLLMALLATATWWLVSNTPRPPGAAAGQPLRKDPDYTMTTFSVTRFGADGKVQVRIDGDMLRHYPDTDRLVIDGVRIHAIGPDGRITDATARRALANGDASEVQLLGGAEVVSQLEGGQTVRVTGEFLHAFVRFERLRSHLPVRVLQDGSDIRAGGIDYDNLARRMELAPPVRARFVPGRPDGAAAATAIAAPAGPAAPDSRASAPAGQ